MANFPDWAVTKEMNRIHTLRQEEWEYVKSHRAEYQRINVPAPYIPAIDEVRRAEAIESLRTKQAMIDDEVQKENDMRDSRNAYAAAAYAAEQASKSKGGYRKSRRSRTPKRVQKRKQTRRHRHRHRR